MEYIILQSGTLRHIFIDIFLIMMRKQICAEGNTKFVFKEDVFISCKLQIIISSNSNKDNPFLKYYASIQIHVVQSITSHNKISVPQWLIWHLFTGRGASINTASSTEPLHCTAVQGKNQPMQWCCCIIFVINRAVQNNNNNYATDEGYSIHFFPQGGNNQVGCNIVIDWWYYTIFPLLLPLLAAMLLAPIATFLLLANYCFLLPIACCFLLPIAYYFCHWLLAACMLLVKCCFLSPVNCCLFCISLLHAHWNPEQTWPKLSLLWNYYCHQLIVDF